MNSLTSQIAEIYQQLIPPMEEGLLVSRLHEKIKVGEIDANFSTQDIQRAIEETSQFNLSGSFVPNRERLLKNLLTYFIERPAEQKNLQRSPARSTSKLPILGLISSQAGMFLKKKSIGSSGRQTIWRHAF